MIRLAALSMAALLGGCGGTGAPAPDATPTTGAPAVTTGPARAETSRTAAAGSTLSADVSSLTGDRSALNIEVTDTATIVSLAADTLFAFDSADLNPAAAATLAKTADVVRQGAAGAVVVTGHTDAKGEDGYNLALSERRAAAVAAWLRGQPGLSGRSFTIAGKGEAEPVAPNTRADGGDDPDGRARNRRVVVTVPR